MGLLICWIQLCNYLLPDGLKKTFPQSKSSDDKYYFSGIYYFLSFPVSQGDKIIIWNTP